MFIVYKIIIGPIFSEYKSIYSQAMEMPAYHKDSSFLMCYQCIVL